MKDKDIFNYRQILAPGKRIKGLFRGDSRKIPLLLQDQFGISSPVFPGNIEEINPGLQPSVFLDI